MLLEGVRSLDEAVEEVREDRKEKERTRLHRRDKEKLERAQLKAISRGQRGYARGGRQVDVQAVSSGAGSAQVGADPAIAAQEQLPLRARPSLQAVKGDSEAAVTVDLTAEDDTQALPRLDSLERKLKDLEQQFG
jgi:hypothetical protein